MDETGIPRKEETIPLDAYGYPGHSLFVTYNFSQEDLEEYWTLKGMNAISEFFHRHGLVRTDFVRPDGTVVD